MSSDHLRVIELFGGIGACSKALERTGIAYDIADYVEIDKYAVASFNALHNTNFEPQDIRMWDKDIKADLIMHGSPCQDFSIAGKQAGGDENSGTRSSLMYETLRIVEKVKPKYVVWENVKNLLSKKHRHNFDAYLKHMESLGYTNYYQVLNAKDYGVPQNRERVFTISILGGGDFKFPEKQPLAKRLKDVIEDNVDEKYYVKKTNNIVFGEQRVHWDNSGKGYGSQQDRAYYQDGVAPALSSCNDSSFSIPDATIWPALKRLLKIETDEFDESIMEFEEKEGVYEKNNRCYFGTGVVPTLTIASPDEKIIVQEPYVVASRGRGEQNEQHLEPRKDGVTNTLTSVQKDNYVATPYRIRKLTPKECWRLMGFDDEDFAKAAKVNSNTQLYKQAGNSIVVNVLEAIFHNLFVEKGVTKVEEMKIAPPNMDHEVAAALEAFKQAKQGAEAVGCKLVGEFEYRGKNITLRFKAS